MRLIKKILFKILPESTYLKILHRSFYILYDLKLLRKNKSFKFHYLVKNIINDDDIVLDIGANLGYFSKTFSNLTPKGKVVCIEPLPQYYQILNYLCAKVSLFPLQDHPDAGNLPCSRFLAYWIQRQRVNTISTNKTQLHWENANAPESGIERLALSFNPLI